MLDQLRKRLKGMGTSAGEQSQREALLDLLLWTMYADNLIALPESEHIEQLAAELSWESPNPPVQYLNKSVSRVRDVHSNPKDAQDFLDDVFDRLRTREMRLEAFQKCRDLAGIDGQISDEENRRLDLIKHRFDIE